MMKLLLASVLLAAVTMAAPCTRDDAAVTNAQALSGNYDMRRALNAAIYKFQSADLDARQTRTGALDTDYKIYAKWTGTASPQGSDCGLGGGYELNKIDPAMNNIAGFPTCAKMAVDGTLHRLLSSGVAKVGFAANAPYAPFYVDTGGSEMSGITPDIVRALLNVIFTHYSTNDATCLAQCAQSNKKIFYQEVLETVDSQIDAYLDALQGQKKFDFSARFLTGTPLSAQFRSQLTTFGCSYQDSTQGVLVSSKYAAAHGANVPSVEQVVVNAAALTFVVQSGSAFRALTEAAFPGATIAEVPTSTDVLETIRNGTYDATVGNSAVLGYFQNQHSGFGMNLVSNPQDTAALADSIPIAFQFRRDVLSAADQTQSALPASPTVVDGKKQQATPAQVRNNNYEIQLVINAALYAVSNRANSDSGSYGAIGQKYFGVNDTTYTPDCGAKGVAHGLANFPATLDVNGKLQAQLDANMVSILSSWGTRPPFTMVENNQMTGFGIDLLREVWLTIADQYKGANARNTFTVEFPVDWTANTDVSLYNYLGNFVPSGAWTMGTVYLAGYAWRRQAASMTCSWFDYGPSGLLLSPTKFPNGASVQEIIDLGTDVTFVERAGSGTVAQREQTFPMSKNVYTLSLDESLTKVLAGQQDWDVIILDKFSALWEANTRLGANNDNQRVAMGSAPALDNVVPLTWQTSYDGNRFQGTLMEEANPQPAPQDLLDACESQNANLVQSNVDLFTYFASMQ